MNDPPSTLIVAPNWIGDAVMAQPLLALLRQRKPRQSIEALCPPHIAPVFRAMREVDAVIEAPNTHGRLDLAARWRLGRVLRARRFDRALVLPNSAKSALVPLFAGIPVRVGYRGEARHFLLNRIHDPQVGPAGAIDRDAGGGGRPAGAAQARRRPADDAQPGADRPAPEDAAAERRPMVEHYAQLAFEPGQPLPGRVQDPRLQRYPEREQAVRRRYDLPADAPILVLCPGAEYGPAKRWPARHFAALAALLADEWPRSAIVLLGSAKERALATEIVALSGHPLRNLCGETSLEDAMAILAQAAGIVSNDSGLMHLAAAYDRPLVAVFGSSDPRHTPPRSGNARVEWLHLDCSPCFQRECPLEHLNCLNHILPGRVLQALRSTVRAEPAA